MAKVIMHVKGVDGEVELLTNRVIIRREGLFNRMKHGMHARREIPLAAITSVNFRDASVFKPGQIDFDFSGRSHTDVKQNAVTFKRKQQQEFTALKDKIFDLLEEGRTAG